MRRRLDHAQTPVTYDHHGVIGFLPFLQEWWVAVVVVRITWVNVWRFSSFNQSLRFLERSDTRIVKFLNECKPSAKKVEKVRV